MKLKVRKVSHRRIVEELKSFWFKKCICHKAIECTANNQVGHIVSEGGIDWKKGHKRNLYWQIVFLGIA